MSGEIVVAAEDVRSPTDMTVNEAVRDHADPDDIAEVLGSPRDSAAADEGTDRTLDEFEGSE